MAERTSKYNALILLEGEANRAISPVVFICWFNLLVLAERTDRQSVAVLSPIFEGGWAELRLEF